MGSASDCRAGCWQFKSQHPTSAETCMWGRWLAAMLALYTGKGVTPEVNLREHILRAPLPNANKAEPTLALKPRGDVSRSPKQGYQWPHKWACVQQKFKKKKSNQHQQTRKISSTVISIPLHYHQRLRVLNIGYILNETNTHVCM